MKKYRWAILIGCAALVLTAGYTGVKATTESRTQLEVVEHADTDTVTDIGATGDSVGDVLTFANPVYNQSNSTAVGSDNGYCFRTVVGAAWECAWTLTLADGQIMAQGPFYDASDSFLAITGGTGAYKRATGQLKLHARNPAGTEYDFSYLLIRP